ncbi:MAG: Gfo/Idh/MocA family oxidoreductase [Candidatus Atribacteria bacterium]|nr:Gfo/Idh/MocA family oxidoreductase [Candidatus Atribacteria bacterium]
MSNLKIAIIGVSHWHVPLYIKGLKEINANVIGVSDYNKDIALNVALDLDTKTFTSPRELIEEEKPDLAFAFSPHNQMYILARQLIECKIPFSIEKPCGLNYQQVNELAELAEQRGTYCTIPFIWRYSDAVNYFKNQNQMSYTHFSFRFVAGPPERYLQNNSPWMLDKAQAGGGCMTNLGVHFIDIVSYLTGINDMQVLGAGYNYTYSYSVEDYAAALLKVGEHTTFSIETGYAFPMDEKHKRENTWTIVTNNAYHSLTDGQIESRFFDGKNNIKYLPTDSDEYYPVFVKETIRQVENGEPSQIDLRQMAHVRKILDDINKTAEINRIKS